MCGSSTVHDAMEVLRTAADGLAIVVEGDHSNMPLIRFRHLCQGHRLTLVELAPHTQALDSHATGFHYRLCRIFVPRMELLWEPTEGPGSVGHHRGICGTDVAVGYLPESSTPVCIPVSVFH